MAQLSITDRKTIASFFMGLSVFSIVFAGVGAFYMDLILASTQWVLLAILFAVWGVYLKLEFKV
ncbi:MAG: hypothetical protein ABIB98_00295 [bacterium]